MSYDHYEKEKKPNIWGDFSGYGYGIWGFWIPRWIPNNSMLIISLLVFCSCITSTTFGYDGSMINGLNILPSYTTYFNLNPATTGLNTASIWIGGILAGLIYGKVSDSIGRRPALFYAALLTVLAVILQAAAQNTAMFVIARILIGFGTSASGVSGPVYLAETLPVGWRAWGVGVFNDFYYVGGLIAAGITYATFNDLGSSTWAWRIPSLIQGLFSIICILLIPFIPESPRWLAANGRVREAEEVLGQMYLNGRVPSSSSPSPPSTENEKKTDGDAEKEDNVVHKELTSILSTLEYERTAGQQLRMREIFRTRGARKRVLLACSAAVFSTIAGNVIASYYLGQMLNNAGITDPKTQLEINIILNAFCLVCALLGTYSCDKWGRKPTVVLSASALTAFIFLIGALTKSFGTSQNTSGIYATVSMIFLFQGSYSFGWTPILYLYPPEVMNFSIRANGMGVFQAVANVTALLFVFTMPIAVANIGWKIYMINGAWDVLCVIAVAYWWVETKDRTLEQIEADIEGVKGGQLKAGDDGQVETGRGGGGGRESAGSEREKEGLEEVV